MPEHDSGEFSEQVQDGQAPGRLPLFLGNRVRPSPSLLGRTAKPESLSAPPPSLQQLAKKLDSIQPPAPPSTEDEPARLELKRPTATPPGGSSSERRLLSGERPSPFGNSPPASQPPVVRDPRELVPETMQRAYYRSQEEPLLEVPSQIPVTPDLAPEVAESPFARAQPAPPQPISLPPAVVAFQRPDDEPIGDVLPPVVDRSGPIPPSGPGQPFSDEFSPHSAPGQERALKALCGALAIVFVVVLLWPGHPSGTAMAGRQQMARTPESLETSVPLKTIRSEEPDSTLTPAKEASPAGPSDVSNDFGPPAAPSPRETAKARPVAAKAAAPPSRPAPSAPSAPVADAGDTGMLNLYTPAPQEPPSTVKPPGQLDAPPPGGEGLTVQVNILPRTVMAHVVITSNDNSYEDKGTGSFELPEVVAGSYNLTVHAVGYKLIKKQIPLTDQHHNIVVVLEPTSGSAPVSAPAPHAAPPVSSPPPSHPDYPPPTKYAPPSPPPGRYEIPAPTL